MMITHKEIVRLIILLKFTL